MAVPHAASILAVAALLAGCAVPSTPKGEEAPAGDRLDEWGEEASPAESPSAPILPGVAGDRGDTFRIGAWGWRRDVKGELEDARRDLDEDGTTFPAGFSFEWRRVRKDREADRWVCAGILAEHFQDDEEASSPGGSVETRARMTGISFPVGLAFDPLDAPGGGAPEAFRWRVDAVPGFRVSSLRVRGEDAGGGGISESDSWLEFSLGVRGEYTPARGVTLFARADVGRGIDFASRSTSWQAMVGLRLRPVEHASLVIGWRTAHLETEEFSNLIIWNLSGRRAEFTASGPWVGVEVDF